SNRQRFALFACHALFPMSGQAQRSTYYDNLSTSVPYTRLCPNQCAPQMLAAQLWPPCTIARLAAISIAGCRPSNLTFSTGQPERCI
ncbi:hypothetical protein, partial [Pseudomonas savastanoi]|uniref:hypothetical protein n=1 Tax=Pseudomonas savastanoi TaxID=29438 RepID=UPI001C7FE7D9